MKIKYGILIIIKMNNHNFLQMVDEQKRQKKLNNKDPIKDLKNLKRSQIGYNNQTNQSDSTRRVTTNANL